MFLLVRALSFAVGLFLLTVGGIYAQSRLAAVWVTSADQSLLLSRVADVAIAPDVGSEALTIELFPAQAFQPITGFGASLTESSAYLLRTIPDSARQSLMERFFHPVTGIGLNVLRQPIGASDFALDHYSYDDMPRGQTDLELQHFSIARDRHYVLPALKEVLNINPEVIIVASPWSAPGWMKTTDSMIGGSLRRDRYAVFAEYLVKFLGAYAAETVPIDFLTVVNEPHYTPVDYPGMYMPAADQATFIREHLGPALRRAGIGTQILAWDHNWHQAQYPIAVMNDPGARPYVAGSAFHCYAGDASMMEEVHAAYPDRAIHVTECSSFGTNADFGRNLLWNARMLVVASLRHWAQSVVTWNLVLDEQGGPRTGGCPNCTGLATIDQRTGTVTFNAEYYALAHASRFIRAGARRIGSSPLSSSDLESVAVQNPDGTRVVLITNSAWVAHQVKVRLGTEASIHQLPPRSIATIVWPATSGAPNDPNFDGTAVPGVVEAERFGNGGPGVSYYDVSPGNWGGQYRNTDVDIEVTSDSGGGYNVGWLRAGEWMAYPLEVPAGGVYGFEARVASKGVGGTFHIEIDGVDKTGRIAIPNTGDWQSWTTLKLPAVTLSAGRRLMRIVIDTAGPAGDAGNLNFVRVTAPTPPSGGSPFNGTPTPLPGVVEAEMFDEGGNLVAYRDLTPENYGAAFRATAVDIEPATGGGFNIGWMQAGEWLQYTVNVASSGTYRVEARVASLGKGGTFHLEANGANISGPLAIPDTGGWQAWRAITVAVSLAAGTQRVRVILDGNGPGGYVGNLDSLRFTVPTAAGNMALKRPVANSSVESSSYQGIHAVDGNLATRWSSAFSDGQWISVDLGATRTIAQVTLRWETAYARAYQLQVSDDASKWTTIWSTTSGDGGVDDVRNLSARGRHVRVVAERRATSWGNSLWEFEVYGPPQ